MGVSRSFCGLDAGKGDTHTMLVHNFIRGSPGQSAALSPHNEAHPAGGG